MMKLQPNWPNTGNFIDYFEEIESQLSVGYIFKKIIYLEEAVSTLLS